MKLPCGVEALSILMGRLDWATSVVSVPGNQTLSVNPSLSVVAICVLLILSLPLESVIVFVLFSTRAEMTRWDPKLGSPYASFPVALATVTLPVSIDE